MAVVDVRAAPRGRDVPRRDPRRSSPSTRPTGSYPPDWTRRLAEAGYVAPHWPRAVGPRRVADRAARDRRGAASARVAPKPMNPIGIGWAGPTLLVAGTAEQQQRYLPGLLDGSEIWCQLFSEPGAGSDLASLRHAAGARRRRVRAQRAEGVDDARARSPATASCSPAPIRTPSRTRASRTSCSTCRRPASGPAARADDRHARVQRGVLRRRAHPRGERRRRRSTTAGGSRRSRSATSGCRSPAKARCGAAARPRTTCSTSSARTAARHRPGAAPAPRRALHRVRGAAAHPAAHRLGEGPGPRARARRRRCARRSPTSTAST